MYDIVKEMPNKTGVDLKSFVKTTKGGYKEADFFHYQLDFTKWETDKEMVIQTIRSINDKFIERFTKEVEPNF